MKRGIVQCRACSGCGCPKCLGFGVRVLGYVKVWGWGKRAIPNLKPEDVPDLSVEEQRECRAFCLKRIERDQKDF